MKKGQLRKKLNKEMTSGPHLITGSNGSLTNIHDHQPQLLHKWQTTQLTIPLPSYLVLYWRLHESTHHGPQKNRHHVHLPNTFQWTTSNSMLLGQSSKSKLHPIFHKIWPSSVMAPFWVELQYDCALMEPSIQTIRLQGMQGKVFWRKLTFVNRLLVHLLIGRIGTRYIQ